MKGINDKKGTRKTRSERQRKIVWDIIGLAIFVILMMVLNNYPTTDTTAIKIIEFINYNFVFILIMSLINLIADLFYSMIIPFSLPAPVFSAIGSIFTITFIFRLFNLVDNITGSDIFVHINWLKWLLYPIVFIIVLISGYVSIFFGMFSIAQAREHANDKYTDDKYKANKHKEEMINITPKKNKSWKNVSDEFKNTLYDILAKVRRRVNKKK